MSFNNTTINSIVIKVHILRKVKKVSMKRKEEEREEEEEKDGGKKKEERRKKKGRK